ncbi:MAG TPA: RNA polymerase sigma factor [Opitutaceae bacterium]|nr:RNA polymerase sigma factor [Opitutaceae bacterium]
MPGIAFCSRSFRQIPKAVTLLRQKHSNPLMEDISDHASWSKWFERYGPQLLLCARQWTHSLADAEDVVQEAFVRFWTHQRGLGGEPLALLLTSVRRAACDRARGESRRLAREGKLAGADLEDGVLFEPLPEGDDRRAEIEAALRRLPCEQREVLVLKIWGELTFEEIAGQLDIPASTAASRYRYALGSLRKELAAPVP